MTRPTLLVASRRASVASALVQYFNLFLPQEGMSHEVRPVWFSCSAELFETLDGLTPQQLRESVVVLDLGAESGDPWGVESMGHERGLASHLILSYPEVYFIFVGASGRLTRPPLDGSAHG